MAVNMGGFEEFILDLGQFDSRLSFESGMLLDVDAHGAYGIDCSEGKGEGGRYSVKRKRDKGTFEAEQNGENHSCKQQTESYGQLIVFGDSRSKRTACGRLPKFVQRHRDREMKDWQL